MERSKANHRWIKYVYLCDVYFVVYVWYVCVVCYVHWRFYVHAVLKCAVLTWCCTRRWTCRVITVFLFLICCFCELSRDRHLHQFCRGKINVDCPWCYHHSRRCVFGRCCDVCSEGVWGTKETCFRSDPQCQICGVGTTDHKHIGALDPFCLFSWLFCFFWSLYFSSYSLLSVLSPSSFSSLFPCSLFFPPLFSGELLYVIIVLILFCTLLSKIFGLKVVKNTVEFS